MTFAQYLRLDIPVWANDQEFAIAALRLLTRRCRRDHRLREARHTFVRDGLKIHHEQQRLCAQFRL